MTDEEQQYIPWNDGIPTKPEVDSLLKAFSPDSILPGKWRATDEELKAIIGRCDGARYRTVYSAWIRRLENDHRVILYRAKVTGFFCPTAEEIYARTHPTIAGAGRKVRKQMRGVYASQPENDLQRGTKEHQGRLLYKTQHDLRKARMNVLPSTEVKEQVKISPPKKANES